MQNKPVDSNIVIKKLQDRLGEAMTTIAILETKVDDLMLEIDNMEKNNFDSQFARDPVEVMKET